jgi:hypothetical protein
MSVLYTLQLELPEDNATTVINNIQVGNDIAYFRFQWAIASEEQYNLIRNYISIKTKSDPINDHGVYTYNYDYMAYYLSLADKTEAELNDWLDTDPPLPNSILNSVRASQLLMFRQRIREALALEPVIAQYKEVVKWQFHVTYKGQTTVGVIEPGGWYRNQDPDMSFRFVSELDHIGRTDFNNVTIEFEVANG